jgi:hypothetical protein
MNAATLEEFTHAVCDLCEIKKEVPGARKTMLMAPNSRLLILAQKAGFSLSPQKINEAVEAHRAVVEALKAEATPPAPAPAPAPAVPATT